jgi:hypothetical protein
LVLNENLGSCDVQPVYQVLKRIQPFKCHQEVGSNPSKDSCSCWEIIEDSWFVLGSRQSGHWGTDQDLKASIHWKCPKSYDSSDVLKTSTFVFGLWWWLLPFLAKKFSNKEVVAVLGGPMKIMKR